MSASTVDSSVGRPAPPLVLPRADEQGVVSLEDLRGRPVLVIFLSHAA